MKEWFVSNTGVRVIIGISMLPLVLWLSAFYISFNPIPANEVTNQRLFDMAHEGNKIRQILFIISALISLMLLKRRKISGNVIPALILCSIFFVSSLWSVAPLLTVRRSILFLLMIIVLLPLASNTGQFIRALKTIRIYALIICFVSLIMYLHGVGLTMMLGEIRLQGPTPQPNALGPLALMGIILGSYLRINKGLLFFVEQIIFCVTLYLTKNRTSYISFLIFIGLYIALKSPGIKMLVKATAIILIISIIGAVGFFNMREFAGRDFTLTGRTFIWNLTIDNIIEHPILGSGYGASFAPVGNSLFNIVLERLNQATLQSHQEILQLFNELGLIFAPLVLIILFLRFDYRTKISRYVLISMVPFFLVETAIFSGTVFSIMFFLLFLHKCDMKNKRVAEIKVPRKELLVQRRGRN